MRGNDGEREEQEDEDENEYEDEDEIDVGEGEYESRKNVVVADLIMLGGCDDGGGVVVKTASSEVRWGHDTYLRKK